MNLKFKNFIIFPALILLLTIANGFSKENFFTKAKKMYDQKKYEDSKFLFQRNITFNPKDAKSYLYLAKIYKEEDNEKEQEKNINTTLLLEPTNEEAMYLLIDIELKRSNFSKVKELTSDFNKICSKMCEKIVSINKRLKNFDTKKNE